MARKPAAALTDAELALMEVLWRTGKASVADVLEALPQPRPQYNSVQTRLNILVEKRYAKRLAHGRAFLYLPVVERDHVVSHAVKNLLVRFFGKGSALALRVISDEPMSEAEIVALKSAIARKAKKK